MLEVNVKPLRKPKSSLIAVKIDRNKRVIPRGDGRKPRWWRVTIGKKFTGTEKRRRFFSSETEANEFIRQTDVASRERGKAAFDISNALAVEALELQNQLQPHGASLTQAVKFFIQNAPIAGKKTINELIPEYLRTKKNPAYRRAQEISLLVFAKDFGNKPAAGIFAPALEKWFAGKKWKPLNERNYMRDLSMFFRWAEMRDYVAGNPFDKVKRPTVERTAPEIFNLEETSKLLAAASENCDLGLLPMYAIGLFSGVRVEELEALTWEMIDWDEGEIRLPGQITKTRMPRNIEIFPALRATLRKHLHEKGPIVCSVNLRLRRQKLIKAAKISNKRNALRHSFASYHAAKYRDPGRLQMLLGQETPSVLFRHYIAATRRTDAERYFKLRPPFAPLKEAEEAPRPCDKARRHA
jgi:integrase